MSISSVTSKVIYVGDAATATLAYPFRILAEGDLTVSRYVTLTSVASALTLNTDYAVTGVGVDAGGNVLLTGSYAGGMPTGSNTVIQRIVPLTQTTDYVENDPFPAETHEKAIDKLCMVNQQLQEQLDRAIKADINQSSGSTTYLEVVSQATIAAASSAAVAVAQVDASSSSAVVSLAAATAAQTYKTNAAASAAQASASAASVSSGVTRALDNLTGVAINESLLPGSGDYISLGSSGYSWLDIHSSGTGNFVTVKATLVSTAALNVPILTLNTGNITTVVSTLLSGSALDVSGSGSITTVRATLLTSSTLRVSGTANIGSIAGMTAPLTIAQGGTQTTAAANAASGVVVLDAFSQLPAVSGALLTSIISSIYDYGTLASAYTSRTLGDLKICYGSLSVTTSQAITNLPFTSSTSYTVTVVYNYAGETSAAAAAIMNSGAQFTIYAGGTMTVNWIAIGT